MKYLNEDTLVQKTTTDYLKSSLSWNSVYAHNQETFGPNGLLGRNSDREVVLTRYLKQALKKFNPHLPETTYDEGVRQVVDYFQSQSMLANGEKAKIGTITAGFEHFHEWKRLSESDHGVVDMETLLKGVCDQKNFMDIFENFIVYDDSSGKQIKVLAKNHQYLGVNQVIKALNDPHRVKGKLGVFWHTQGAGKSYSMVFFTTKVHRKIGGNYTFLICTDRDDLDTQIYKTFAGCGVADNDRTPCRPSSGRHLAELMSQRKAYVFTTIQKFNQEVDPDESYTRRDDIIVITDEAHRTQYGTLALNMRNALPKANFIGFTGTPLFKDDQITMQVFGEYVSTYDFQRSVEDKSTVPLYYDSRGDTLGVATNDINERIAEKLEEIEINDIDVSQRLERELKRDYHIITAEKRLNQIAQDFVQHYTTSWEAGKAMLVCIDKLTCVRMYELIRQYWDQKAEEVRESWNMAAGEKREHFSNQLIWMKETKMAVIVSEEQGEVEKFRKWGFDIIPHRRLIKHGFELSDGTRIDVDSAFKKDGHPFRIAIVCAMWLTGFDVPSLANLYLDKPLKAHTLMQAIARANRVNGDKNNGLIIDYCGILKNLRKALATFTGTADTGRIGGGGLGPGELDPTRTKEELLENLRETISLVSDFLNERKAPLEAIINTSGFERNKAIVAAKEAVNENDETRKKFEVMCREVFIKFKACLTIPGINAYHNQYNAINIIYKSLQKDIERADISDIIKMLHKIIDESITVKQGKGKEPNKS